MFEYFKTWTKYGSRHTQNQITNTVDQCHAFGAPKPTTVVAGSGFKLSVGLDTIIVINLRCPDLLKLKQR